MADHQAAAAAVPRTEEDVRTRVRTIVLELAPNPENLPGEDGRLVEDLGYHSLALLELAFTLEDDFELSPIDEQTARAIINIRDVQDHVVNEFRSTGKLR
jgi:acyl carrier protein